MRNMPNNSIKLFKDEVHNSLELVENNKSICEFWRRGETEKEEDYAHFFSMAVLMYQKLKEIQNNIIHHDGIDYKDLENLIKSIEQK
ncbi:MAG: hypothetical protein PHT94_00755 [Candidatus Nanoarchaeia archaeon]|nr:hypothetical protein [Candidatus Nanoarchaeia archaeon]